MERQEKLLALAEAEENLYVPIFFQRKGETDFTVSSPDYSNAFLPGLDIHEIYEADLLHYL